MFRGFTGLVSLLKQAQELSGRMKGLSEELRVLRATGTAAGGMVEVEVNGLLEVLRLSIDPQLVAQGDRELLEDLVTTAVNQAISKGKQLHTEALRSMTGGLELSGFEETLENLVAGAAPEEPESPPDAETTEDTEQE